METKIDQKALSKTLAHALRHEPQTYGLVLDAEGWVTLDAILGALRKQKRAWSGVQVSDLEAMLAASAKRRFEISEGRIRAIYGHSVEGKVEREQQAPPEILYHGTPPDIAAIIRVEGLKPMSRQYVHLSSDVATASEVGRRRSGKPVILEIEALRAHEAGHAFYIGHDRVWLCDALPPEFIRA